MANGFGKLFQDMRRDVRKAAAESARYTATLLTHEIQNRSPYWDGYFANEWVVQQGDVVIPAVYDGVARSPKPQRRDITLATVPAPKRVGDSFVYTIGNRMKYRAVAMDLVPGRNAEGNWLNYVEKGWFETYNQGGEQLRVMEKATNIAFRALGFK